MNAIQIAEQALCYRNNMVADSFTAGRFDPASIASIAVDCADPLVNGAIRRLSTAWVRGGLDPAMITNPWNDERVDQIFADDPSLLDAIDDIIRVAHRVQFSRPRPRPNMRPRSAPTVRPIDYDPRSRQLTSRR